MNKFISKLKLKSETSVNPNPASIETKTSPRIIELYTSQGCSSCPPADVLLSTLKDNENVAILSFHVDYWNYLGWTDPHSIPKYSQRQRDFNTARNSTRVYTPQMVVDGQTEFVGSSKSKLGQALSITRQKNLPVELEVEYEGDEIGFKIKTTPGYWLNVAVTRDEVQDSCDKGENSGRVLKHDGVVVWFQRKLVDEEASYFRVQKGLGSKVIAYVQDSSYTVLGSAQRSL